MIEVRVKELLQERSRTFYWLAKQTGISHTTLWRLKKGKAYGVTLDTLDKICQALDCQPGDILRYVSARPARKRSAKAKA
jgi:putative transcriptional regulator